MASTFKQQCLALPDQVESTKVPIIVTKDTAIREHAQTTRDVRTVW